MSDPDTRAGYGYCEQGHVLHRREGGFYTCDECLVEVEPVQGQESARAERWEREREADERFAENDPGVDWPSDEHDRAVDAICAALDRVRTEQDEARRDLEAFQDYEADAFAGEVDARKRMLELKAALSTARESAEFIKKSAELTVRQLRDPETKWVGHPANNLDLLAEHATEILATLPEQQGGDDDLDKRLCSCPGPNTTAVECPIHGDGI